MPLSGVAAYRPAVVHAFSFAFVVFLAVVLCCLSPRYCPRTSSSVTVE